MLRLGYNKPLYILPFDHRNTFLKSMYHVDTLNEKQIEQIKEFKKIIYLGFKWAIKKGVPKENAAILIDDQYGKEVMQLAKEDRVAVLYTLEKSGVEFVEFAHANWQEKVKQYNPEFCKMLVKYNPDDENLQKEQKLSVLKIASDFTHENGYKFLIEPLIPATNQQLTKVNNNKDEYDQKIRPLLTIAMIKEMQEAGVEPDIWKLEGMNLEDDYKNVVRQARFDNRENVSVVILGRGANFEKVSNWLRVGAKVNGVIGFAVGRTIFWEALEEYREGKISSGDAVIKIGGNFMKCYEIFTHSN